MAAFKTDKQILRDYITANDHLQYTQLPDGVVAVLLTHSNLDAKHLDIRLDLHNKIEDVKEKLRTHIGTPVLHQRLILRNQGRDICEMGDNSKMLGFYSVESGMEIHVIDTDPFSLSRNGGLTDTSLVEKYRLSDEAYEKRSGTMREFIREQRKKDPNFKLKPSANTKMGVSGSTAAVGAESAGGGESAPAYDPPPGAESVAGISVGDRCEVTPGERRGTIKFIGEIPEIKVGGFWVGVQLDEPIGSNDGSVKGTRYFECPEKYGAFVRGTNVKVGDFPERDIFADEEDEI